MYKVLKADKDAYLTDRVIKGSRVFSANTGGASSLDLFKLIGFTSSGSLPNVELSRLLVHFDLQPLRDLVSSGQVDTSNSTFSCMMKLYDVYGGQPTPNNFTVAVHPLSASFDEGVGHDVVFYSDSDVCNFLSSSMSGGTWLSSGCNLGGGLPGSVDYVTASTQVNSGASLKAVQLFKTGEEDLYVDVTKIVSATLAGLLPDSGLRISYDTSLENDQHTYFVKRFASRTAFNADKHPQLIVRYDDSVQDDSQNLTFDSPSYLFLYNHVRQSPSNIVSGSSQITGSNSLILKLSTEVSGGTYNLVFTGSQHTLGAVPVVGVYSASVTIHSTDAVLGAKLAQSGSVKFTPIWGSLDGTVAYLTGSSIFALPPQRSTVASTFDKLIVTVIGLHDDHDSDELVTLRVNIFDHTSPLIKATKFPVRLPGIVIRDVHYQVSDAVSGRVVIPFDAHINSTRLSSDASGMFFKLDISNLTPDRSYVTDIMVITGNTRQVFKAASPVFRVNDVA